MADDFFDLFNREFGILRKNQQDSLERMEQQHAATMAAISEAARSAQADITRTASAALAEVPARIEAAFADGVAAIGNATRQAERAALTLDRTGTRLEQVTRAHLLDHLYLMAIWLGGLAAFAFLFVQLYNLAKEPTYKDHWLLCTAAWVDKTRECKGKIYTVPEDYAAGNRAAQR